MTLLPSLKALLRKWTRQTEKEFQLPSSAEEGTADAPASAGVGLVKKLNSARFLPGQSPCFFSASDLRICRRVLFIDQHPPSRRAARRLCPPQLRRAADAGNRVAPGIERPVAPRARRGCG